MEHSSIDSILPSVEIFMIMYLRSRILDRLIGSHEVDAGSRRHWIEIFVFFTARKQETDS